MAVSIKNQKEILDKLRIKQLNPMQVDAHQAIYSNKEVIILSPTGSGKTLALLLPIFAEIVPNTRGVQALIIAPSRELAIQLEQVAREMGTGYKINVVYGGRPFSKDRFDLKNEPSVLIGTPGRIADHIRRKTIDTNSIKTLVLDEFDKSLEIGFEDEMSEIIMNLKQVNKKILTSATHGVEIPAFVKLEDPEIINYLDQGLPQLIIKRVISPDKDKLKTLVELLCHLGNHPCIVFCNYKDSIQRVSQYLSQNGINHGCFYGGLEQIDRERALIKFRNGSHQLLIATDLAARGLDIPSIKYIIHYHLPQRAEEFIHRNGRTARMQSDGTAYIIQWEAEELSDFLKNTEGKEFDIEAIKKSPIPLQSAWTTLFISGGRKDKISKGDIVGILMKQGSLIKDEIGLIELKQDCSFVAVHQKKAIQVISRLDNIRLKKKKVRIKEI